MECRNDDDILSAVANQFLEHIKTIHVREANIKDDHVGIKKVALIQTL